MDVGKRMIDVLIRLANDSLAYYMQDEITRSLYQANRDADLSEAYDDKGVSGGNKLASMIKNVEEAVERLKERVGIFSGSLCVAASTNYSSINERTKCSFCRAISKVSNI